MAFSLNIRGSLIPITQPWVVGIINCTPDSFYSGSRFEASEVLEQIQLQIAQGADMVDLGAQSTRPNAPLLAWQEEWDRLEPCLESVYNHYPSNPPLLSIDTLHSQVAEKAVAYPIAMINSVGCNQESSEIYSIAAKAKIPVVIMHNRGNAATMTSLNQYKNLLEEVAVELEKQVKSAKEKGVCDILIDPGFGFAKNPDQNFKLLKELPQLSTLLNLPLYIGISRKSLIWRTLSIKPEEALNGTTALNMFALMQGAQFIRVHDVKEAVEVVNLFKAIK